MKAPLIVALEYALKELRGYPQRLERLRVLADLGNGRHRADLAYVAEIERDRLTDLEAEIRFEGCTVEQLAEVLDGTVRSYRETSDKLAPLYDPWKVDQPVPADLVANASFHLKVPLDVPTNLGEVRSLIVRR